MPTPTPKPNQAELVDALSAQLRGWGGAVRVLPTPGGEVTFCEQLRLWLGLGLGLGAAEPKPKPKPKP